MRSRNPYAIGYLMKAWIPHGDRTPYDDLDTPCTSNNPMHDDRRLAFLGSEKGRGPLQPLQHKRASIRTIMTTEKRSSRTCRTTEKALSVRKRLPDATNRTISELGYRRWLLHLLVSEV